MNHRETELNMVTKPDPQNLTAPVSEMRSRIMRAVPRTNTRPEILVRKLLHGLGLRFRIHQKALAGTPDIVLTRHRTAIFVHGCFWHRHADCSKATTPKTRAEFWQAKFDRNKDRDQENERTLVAAGWRVVTVWECETRKPQALADRLRVTFGLNAPVD